MKSTIYLLLLGIVCSVHTFAQQTFDFFLDPETTGWEYYSDVQSGGFSYAGGQGAINYSIITGTGSQFYHRDLDPILRNNYCVSIKIMPYENNYNTFFPLLLTEAEQQGPNYHPWRENPIGMAAGPLQNLDLIGIEVFGMEIRFVHRNDNLSPGSIIQSLTPACIMSSGGAYWVRLEVSNVTNADIRVFTDEAQTQQIASGQFTIPALEDLTHLYIANGNGNSNTSQYGVLDDYIINNCFLETTEELIQPEALVFPNPADGTATIELSHSFDEIAGIRVIDYSGRIMYQSEVAAGEQNISLPLTHFSNGTYIVDISTSTAHIRKELVVLH